MKKANRILNVVLCAFLGGFIGHALFLLWDRKKNPGFYDMQSAPWYTGLLVSGAFALAGVLLCLLLKFLLRRRMKKNARDAEP
ncbi:MAG: hypothetical protein IK141_06825 [Clostridia bacterium]|nr:hypothetical protein [Clostridia bacterium]